jgi:hypothetical protein
VGRVGDAPDDAERTVVRHGPGMRDHAQLVAAALRAAPRFEEDDSVGDEVVLWTGADFAGVNLAAAVPLPGVGADPGEPAGGAGEPGPLADEAPAAPPTTEAPGFTPGPPPEGVVCR